MLKSSARSPSARVAKGAGAGFLISADGAANTTIAAAVSVSPHRGELAHRFAEDDLVKFAQVREGRGRRP